MQIFSPLFSSTLDLPANSYIYTLVPTSRGLAAISSDDSLRLFDSSSPSSQPLTWSNVNTSVTCLKGFDNNVVATAGRDGLVKFWDVREKSLRNSITFTAGGRHFSSFVNVNRSMSVRRSQADVHFEASRSPH